MTKVFFLFYFLWMFTNAFSQTQEAAPGYLADPSLNNVSSLEVLNQLYQNPLNINTATREDLRSIYFLSEKQITAIQKHIKKYGALLSLEELQVVEGLDPATIAQLKPFITFNTPNFKTGFPNKIVSNKNQYVLFRMKRSIKDDNGKYAGSDWAIAGKYRNSQRNNFSIGFSFEKDAGEKFRIDGGSTLKGFDYYAFHLALFNRKRLKRIVVGDYTLQCGQGLVVGTGFSMGKGAEPITGIRKVHTGIKPFSSFAESGFFRGIASTISISKRWDITPFFSLKKIDGHLDSSNTLFISAPSSGYHRSAGELKARKTVKETLGGIDLGFTSSNKKLRAGINFIGIHYDKTLQPEDKIYNRFAFTGKNHFTTGVHYSWQYQNLNFFGEMAIDENGGKGFIQGMLASLSPKIGYSILYHSYDKNFNTLYSNAFSEKSGCTNEKGFYQGIKISPVSKAQMSAYFDIYRFPWLSYQILSPSGGSEYALKLAYTFSPDILFYVQYKQEKKEKTASGASAIPPINQTEKKLFQSSLSISQEGFNFTTRLIISKYTENKVANQGFTLAEDIAIKAKKYAASMRFALFDTEYSNRHYLYEKDLLYTFSVPAYFGRGVRTSLVCKIVLLKNISFWLKYARTLSFTAASKQVALPKTELKFQLIWKY